MDKIPFDLELLQLHHPDAFKELAAMEPMERHVMLVLLNGQTTSPPARGYADIEVDKEDAVISKLRIDRLVDITTKTAHGKFAYHMMTHLQISEFLYDREAMRKRVNQSVWLRRSFELDRQLSKAIQWLGVTCLVNRIGELAANDPVYDDKKQKEPKP
ncbi:hypothetical protein [Shewanella xiamenensis]|uniref:hypothetical protein n=1 Tax=Shewanella xiamenensis TaxID=332186 RepID=UPI00313C563B